MSNTKIPKVQFTSKVFNNIASTIVSLDLSLLITSLNGISLIRLIPCSLSGNVMLCNDSIWRIPSRLDAWGATSAPLAHGNRLSHPLGNSIDVHSAWAGGAGGSARSSWRFPMRSVILVDLACLLTQELPVIKFLRGDCKALHIGVNLGHIKCISAGSSPPSRVSWSKRATKSLQKAVGLHATLCNIIHTRGEVKVE